MAEMGRTYSMHGQCMISNMFTFLSGNITNVQFSHQKYKLDRHYGTVHTQRAEFQILTIYCSLYSIQHSYLTCYYSCISVTTTRSHSITLLSYYNCSCTHARAHTHTQTYIQGSFPSMLKADNLLFLPVQKQLQCTDYIHRPLCFGNKNVSEAVRATMPGVSEDNVLRLYSPFRGKSNLWISA
jgi:hypothetical protein